VGGIGKDEEGEMALRGEGGSGFVEEEAELVVEDGEEGFAVRADVEGAAAVGLITLAFSPYAHGRK
jgi:hypothetical protein